MVIHTQRHLRGLFRPASPGGLLRTFACALLFLLQLPAFAGIGDHDSRQPTRISVSCKDKPLKWVLGQFEKQSGYSFVYSNDELDVNTRCSITIKKLALNDALNELLSPLKMNFEISGDKILVRSENSTFRGVAMAATDGSATAPPITVRGKVLDEKGAPLSGVSVTLKGGTANTTTDSDGRFTLQIPESTGTLRFTYVGYEAKEVAASPSELTVSLTPVDKSLDQVVVVGYGTQKKVSVSGGVDVIRSQALEGRATTNLTQALQGTSPGLTIQQTSFEPGQPLNINIRGIGTLGDNSPLVVIDGLVGGDINTLNPSDIDNISVLKDAGSAAIYGSRSSNGVILITTKKGKKGEGNVTYNGIYSKVQPHIWMKPVAGWENMMLKDEALVNAGQTPFYSPMDIEAQKAHGDEQWFLDAIFRRSTQQNHNLSISGGRDRSTYLVSAGYMDQESNFVGPAKGLKRYNFRMNFTNEVGRLKVNSILAYAKTKIRDHSYSTGTLVIDAERTPPYYKLKDSLGRYLINDVLAQFNPLGILEQGGFRDYDNDNLFGSVNGELTILKGLKLRGTFGGTLEADHQYYVTQYVPFYRAGQAVGSPAAGLYGNALGNVTGDVNNKNLFLNSQLFLDYTHDFGRHHLQLLGGYTNESYTAQGNKVVLNYTSPDLNLPQSSTIVNIGDQQITPQNTNQSSLNSFIGRASYSYDDKYFAEASFRADGSSKFAKQNRWGYFPSISAAWRISREDFFANSPAANYVNELKLRSSYGQLGNQNVNNYQYQTTYTVYSNMYGFNNNAVSGTGFNTANPDIKWEVANTFNIGIDAGLLKNRVNISFDYFDKLTKNILMQPNLPGTYGGGTVDYNIASVRNKGWELNLSYNIPGGAVHQTIGINIGNTNNKITRMANDQDRIQSLEELQVIYGKGLPIASYVGYKRDGYFQNLKDIQNKPRFTGLAVAPGDIAYKDKNGDGVIDDNDRYILGNPFPHYIFGVTYSLSWKELDFGFLIQGVGQRDMALRGELIEPFHANYSFTMFEHQLDYWRPDNPNARFPRLATNGSASNTNNFRKGSDLYVLNAAYARLKNVQIGYTLSPVIAHRLGLQKLRAYLTGQNLLTLTKNRFLDPETSEFHNGSNNLNATNGANSGRSYPTLQYYGFGLDVTF